MSISGIKAGVSAYQNIEKITQQSPAQGIEKAGKVEKKEGFAELLKDAVSEVDQMQKSADDKIASLVSGKGKVTTHQAMIALEQADVAFQLMNQVRSKIVRAYEEVMRTQV